MVATKVRGWAGGVKEELRRTRSEAERYRVGWTRLGVGGKKRRAAALVAEAEVGSRGWVTMKAADQMTARQMPPRCALERGVRFCPLLPLIVTDPRRDRRGR